jgi:hypothetical protein
MEMRDFKLGADVLYFPLTRYFHAGRKDFPSSAACNSMFS